MTQLNDKDHAAQMADMKSFDEEMPSIGIFWYDPKDHSLFGVGKKELTPREVEEARAKGVDVINYPECGYKAAIEREQCDAFIDTAEWLGISTSSSCWWVNGPSLCRMSLPS